MTQLNLSTARIRSEPDIRNPGNPLGSFHSSIDVSSSSSPLHNSADCMVFSRDGTDAFVKDLEGEYHVGKTLFLNKRKFRLLHLVTLFYMVHREKPDYRVTDYNCYWFSKAIYSSILGLNLADCTETSEDGVFIGNMIKVISSLPGDVQPSFFINNFPSEWEKTWQKIEAVRQRARRVCFDSPLSSFSTVTSCCSRYWKLGRKPRQRDRPDCRRDRPDCRLTREPRGRDKSACRRDRPD